MRRNPGGWLREKLRERLVEVGVLLAMGAAWLCGAVLALLIGLGPGFWSEWASWMVLVPGVVFLGVALFRARSGWRIGNMNKGARAEEEIGQAIEYALTQDSCAVAHHVERIAKVGDIDHLVATPSGLWVIETKLRRVSPEEFPRVLQSIARNVKGVREWAPSARVTGCLVFASEQRRPKSTYTHERETIRAFADATELRRALRNDVRGAGGPTDLAARVWKLAELKSDQSVPAPHMAP